MNTEGQRSEALLRTGALQNAIFNSANFSSIATDASGVIQIFNVGAERMLGYTAAEVVNRITPADISDPQERIVRAAALSAELGTPIAPGFEALVFKASRGIEDIYQLTYIRKDGSRFPAVVSITALRDGHDTILGYLLIGTDNTARKQAEAALLKANALQSAELEHRVAERTAELREANHELEAFSYSVSHDLRAPVRHINGFADLLRRHSSAALDDQGRRYLAAISESARSMGTLIDDLLSFSRMGRAEMRQSVVNLAAMVATVRASLKLEMTDRDIRWIVTALPLAHGDPSLLRQVFTNLLSNAIKYTRGRTPAIITVGSLEDSDELVLFVQDNGAGFDMAYASKLFGVFQRLHSSDEFEGTGIGLANVRRIIQRHGGRVWAEGHLGMGATFYIAIPKLKETFHQHEEAA